MRTNIARIVCSIGIGLFFLVTGFKEQSLLLKHQVGIREEKLHDTIHTDDTKWMLNFIPDVTVQLVTGEYIQLPKLIDEKKYVFINVWSGRKGIDKDELGIIDSIAGIYKNKLMVIGLLDDGNLIQLNRLIKKYRLKNVQGLVSKGIKSELKADACPYGILFSRTGKLIATGMDGNALAAYLEKHVVVSRAKF
jgi:hypothetical protein